MAFPKLLTYLCRSFPKPRLNLPLRLTALPSLAGLVVVMLSFITVFELSDAIREATQGPRAKAKKEVPTSPQAQTPNLSETEALRLLGERRDAPGKILALERLRLEPAHEEDLFRELLRRDTPAEARLRLLSFFKECLKERALEAARALLKEKDLTHEILLSAAFELLAKGGAKEDLSLFSERPGEDHQLKTLREKYRDELEKRTE